MSKIEEVAAAMAAANIESIGKPIGKQEFYRLLALAALRALREPDEGMLAAGDRAIFHADPDWQSNACWRAMIASILSEEEDQP